MLPKGRDPKERVPALTLHLLMRVFIDAQWAPDTREADYLTDLRAAVRFQHSHLGLFVRRAGSMAAIVAETDSLVPNERRGEKWLPNMIVVYSADRGMIVSGYQFSTMMAVAIPEDVQWLK